MDIPCNNLSLLPFPVDIICQTDGEAESGGKGGFDHLELEPSMRSRTYNSDSITPPMIIVYSGLYCLNN